MTIRPRAIWSTLQLATRRAGRIMASSGRGTIGNVWPVGAPAAPVATIAPPRAPPRNVGERGATKRPFRRPCGSYRGLMQDRKATCGVQRNAGSGVIAPPWHGKK